MQVYFTVMWVENSGTQAGVRSVWGPHSTGLTVITWFIIITIAVVFIVSVFHLIRLWKEPCRWVLSESVGKGTWSLMTMFVPWTWRSLQLWSHMWYREVDGQTNEVKSPCDPENEATKIAAFRYRNSNPCCGSRSNPSSSAGILFTSYILFLKSGSLDNSIREFSLP